ncbi:MAG: biotin transporter BioY [Candidatus Korobacteraceae bacterium]|jgi:biotin transport system substrate-specific component
MSKALHIDSQVAEQPLRLVKQIAIVICASAVIAVCARLAVPLPFTPVPLTLANFGVLLVGLSLGSRRGFAAAALYLSWGAMGLPVFASAGPGSFAQMLGPTGGYLWAYPVIAFLAGWIAERGQPSFLRNLTGAVVAEVVLFVAGIGWLAIITHSWRQAAFFGLYPFLFAEVSKVMLAAAAALRLRRSL